MPRSKKHCDTGNKAEQALNSAVTLADELSEFESFRAQVLPALRADLAKGLSDVQIIEKYKAVAAARLISLIAEAGDNANLALTASRDVLDRTLGKATEKKVVEHRLARLPEEQLDAILTSKLNELEPGSDEE